MKTQWSWHGEITMSQSVMIILQSHDESTMIMITWCNHDESMILPRWSDESSLMTRRNQDAPTTIKVKSLTFARILTSWLFKQMAFVRSLPDAWYATFLLRARGGFVWNYLYHKQEGLKKMEGRRDKCFCWKRWNISSPELMEDMFYLVNAFKPTGLFSCLIDRVCSEISHSN